MWSAKGSLTLENWYCRTGKALKALKGFGKKCTVEILVTTYKNRKGEIYVQALNKRKYL